MIAAVAAPGLFPNILRVGNLANAQGRLEVPVAPINSVYAHFEHLRVVPSPEGGAPLFKLRVLDKLIDRLLAEGQSVPETARLPGLEPGQAQAMIGELGARLQQRLGRLAALSGFAPETGMLFELVA